MTIKENILDLIGNTPLVRLKNIEKKFNLDGAIYAKLERCNPTGSIKDRAAKQMLLDALKEGKITKDSIIVEPTSGNTGISLAALCAYMKLKLIIFMPENCSIERIKMMRAFNAEVILTPKEDGMSGSIKAAIEYKETHKNVFIPDQFNNESNVKAHYLSTGPEIYQALNGKLDYFVAAFGTGGTLTGVSKYLKKQNPDIKAIGLEPASSPFYTEHKKGLHKIQGIGAGFVPSIMDPSLIDDVLTVTDEDAYEYTRLLAKEEGLFCGITSGCNLFGAIEVLKKHPFSTIVTVFPDDGERYLSVEGLYE